MNQSFEKITAALKKCKADAWELIETATSGWEFYFIRRRLDQHRASDVRTYTVKVYKYIDDKKFLGSASGVIYPTADDASVEKTLSRLVLRAALVKNPAYTLADKPVTVPPKTDPVDLKKISADFIDAVLSVPETSGEDVNSFEIFVNSVTRHTLNSNGVEYTCVYPSSTLELVVNARNGSHEIELYRYATSGSCDKRRIARDVADAMRFGRDRLKAEPTPNLKKFDVVFSTSDSVEIYDYCLSRHSAGFKFRKISDCEIGSSVCAAGDGDRLTLEALTALPNSSLDCPVDEEGSVVRDRFLIRDGVAENFWGSRQFSCYLGLKDSSIVSNVRVSGGRDMASVRSGDYLEVVEFSSFQVDPIGGDIAGEIRLGYLHRGGEVKIVTGGSVSGSMSEAAPTMRFSDKCVQYDGFVVPAATRLKNLRVTGVVEDRYAQFFISYLIHK